MYTPASVATSAIPPTPNRPLVYSSRGDGKGIILGVPFEASIDAPEDKLLIHPSVLADITDYLLAASGGRCEINFKK